MNDRELLTLAAKAAGIELVWSSEQDMAPMIKGVTGNSTRCWFSPLTDDGDALRLAVKLRMQIQINDFSVVIYRQQLPNGVTPPECYEYPDSVQGEDYAIQHINHDAATRRAITRAAAEIGKEMK